MLSILIGVENMDLIIAIFNRTNGSKKEQKKEIIICPKKY